VASSQAEQNMSHSLPQQAQALDDRHLFGALTASNKFPSEVIGYKLLEALEQVCKVRESLVRL